MKKNLLQSQLTLTLYSWSSCIFELFGVRQKWEREPVNQGLFWVLKHPLVVQLIALNYNWTSLNPEQRFNGTMVCPAYETWPTATCVTLHVGWKQLVKPVRFSLQRPWPTNVSSLKVYAHHVIRSQEPNAAMLLLFSMKNAKHICWKSKSEA